MNRLDSRFAHEWHVAINQHAAPLMGGGEWPKWMYEAKAMADEVPRMAMLFRRERENALPTVHKQCSMTPAVPVKDNHLSCCLGVKCKECPELLALEKMQRSPEDIDTAKAWTCASHIASKGGDFMNEGYLLTVDDRMYWDNVHASLASADGCAAHGLAHPCEVCAAESQLEQMRQDGNADDATEAAAHLERVKHDHGVEASSRYQQSNGPAMVREALKTTMKIAAAAGAPASAPCSAAGGQCEWPHTCAERGSCAYGVLASAPCSAAGGQCEWPHTCAERGSCAYGVQEDQRG